MYNPLKLQQVLLLAKQERWDYKRLRREMEKILALDTSEIIFAKDVMNAEQLISFLDGTTGKVAWQDYLTTAKNAEIFTPNYKFYARQKNVVRDDFIAIFKHNIKRQQTEAELKRDIGAVMQKYKNSAGTIANTALAQFTRYQNFEKMKDAGITLFKYVGPPPERDFCKQWYNRTVTLSELETLKNSFGNSAKVDCGGWNCRHHWQAVVESDTPVNIAKFVQGDILGKKQKQTANNIPVNVKETSNEIVTNSIAGVNKGELMTSTIALKGTNPKFDNEQNNGYNRNCQTCVVAYEARLRGFNVTAKPETSKNQYIQQLANDTTLAWIDPATEKKPKKIIASKVQDVKALNRWLYENVNVGNRYTFEYDYKDFPSGHILCIAKNSNGDLVITDPQNGKELRGKKIIKHLEEIDLYYSVPKLTRIDNLEINKEFADNILKESEE